MINKPSIEFYDIAAKLRITTIEVEFIFDSSTKIDGWIGSYIRNGLLTACNSIELKNGISLVDIINRFPLPKNHPWYSKLKGGFHRGYAIRLLSHQNYSTRQIYLEPNIPLRFELVLFGNMDKYKNEFTSAIMLFAKTGICGSKLNAVVSVNSPKTIADMYSLYEQDTIILQFKSPLSLFKQIDKYDSDSYQLKMNCIPSLYSTVHALVNRLQQLLVLYCDCNINVAEAYRMASQVESIAMSAELILCDIKRSFFESKQRSNNRARIIFNGFTGRIIWGRNALALIPLLRLGSSTLIGYNTVYGLGDYILLENNKNSCEKELNL